MPQTTTEASSTSNEDRCILRPGRNYWRRKPATRLKTLVDAADYFAAFAETCRAARHQILILGWDFDRCERLYHDDGHRDLPDELGAFLVALVKRVPTLKIYLLSWDFHLVYAAERELLPALRLRLQAPPRFHFRLDGEHPAGASHHQKVVVVDDRVAFAGGIDLSRWRWDTCEHRPDDSRRTDPDGNPYPPFHDLMMMVEGNAAASLGDLARERWRRAHGWRLRPPPSRSDSPWPASIAAELCDVDVAIVRTQPAMRDREAVAEVENLYLDAIESAQRCVYIENQYFTARRLTDALAKRLRDASGPEVVLVLPEKTGGWLERVTMDVIRGRMLRRLTEADAHDRLRIYYPYQPGLGDDCISVHAKLLIVDEQLLRIGSSNASNRSMGLDTECDLAIEAAHAGDATARYISELRNRLLAEHLGCDIDTVNKALAEHGGLVAVVESPRSDGRSLRPLSWHVDEEVDQLVPDDIVVDPAEPLSPDYFVAEYVPASGRSSGRRRLYLFTGLVVALLGLAAAWRWTPLQSLLSPENISAYLEGIASTEMRVAVAIGGFVIASLAMVPVTLLAVIGGIVFDGWLAFFSVLAGAMLAALIGFFGGRLLGNDLIERISGGKIDKLSKRLAQRGTFAVAALRLIPVAPFAIFNLVAGISHLGTRQFIIGSLLGMAPGLAAITLFSNSLWQALKSPSLFNIAVALAVGVGIASLAWLAQRWLRTS